MSASRHLARRCAVQALYQWRITGQPADIEGHFIRNERLRGEPLEYFRDLIRRVLAHIEVIDGRIAPHLDRDPATLDVTEQAILRLATVELLYRPEVPAAVVLDEAVKLAKVFCAENGYKYVNGVLDKIARANSAAGADDNPTD